MDGRILITGARGLVGTALARALQARGTGVVEVDLRAPRPVDVRDRGSLRTALSDCAGIVHLAAVSRVAWAQRDPAWCRSTNVGGTREVLEAALKSPARPWVLFASSREVYGQPARLPVDEDAPLRPLNVYGRSKVEGEGLVEAARSRGLATAIVRLSNVYGSTADHADRVVPAFARAAAASGRLRVEGRDNRFDFTHVADVTTGLLALVDALGAGEQPPPIQLVTGEPTALGDLASLAVALAGSTATVEEAPPRSFDVSHFHGVPDRARALLGWRARVGLREGLARLIADFASGAGAAAPAPAATAGERSGAPRP